MKNGSSCGETRDAVEQPVVGLPDDGLVGESEGRRWSSVSKERLAVYRSVEISYGRCDLVALDARRSDGDGADAR